jgi:DNA-binding transcriptional MerR regulator
MEKETLVKVGDLARRTGVSVRTLHYYEEIGLLVPSHRTAAGHRLYTAGDVVRLQQVKSLRALGFTLDEVRECLRSPRYAPLRVLEDHAARAREQLDLQRELVERLDGLLRLLRRGDTTDTEAFLKTIEVMTMWENKFTPEQRAEVKERGAQLGPEKIREVEQEWVALIAAMRAEMEKGTDPTSDAVQAIARRSRELVAMFSGGNEAIEGTLRDAYRGGAGASFGLDAELAAYWERASNKGSGDR